MKKTNFVSALLAVLAMGVAQYANAQTLSTSGTALGSNTYGPRGSCGAIDLTQSTDPNTALFGFSVACFNAGNVCTVENFYARSFDLALGATSGNAHFVRCVEFGVDETLGANPVDINIYEDTNGGAPNNANLVLLGTMSVPLADGLAGVLVSADLSALNILVPANVDMVVEVHSADLCTSPGPSNYYFNGANDAGQTGSSYIKAAGCGLPDYLALSAIGFPSQHMVMTVELDAAVPGACCFTDGTACSCTEVLESECGDPGETFQGAGTTCATADCGDCNNNGVCDLIDTKGTPQINKDFTIDLVPDLDVPDGIGFCGPGGPVSTNFVVATAGIIADVDIDIDYSHTWYGDNRMEISHNATTVLLLEEATPDDSSDMNGVYVFNDDAPAVMSFDAAAVATGGAPAFIPPGHYFPDNPLSAFDGQQKQGVWTLTLEDYCQGDPGLLRAWSIWIDNAAVPPTSADCDMDNVPDECEPDTDMDGTIDDCDPCPLDPDDDKDGDGLCCNPPGGPAGDACCNDPDNDKDGDGICGDVDACPNDPDNDKDGDGQCGNVDPCPNDPDNDKDGDGMCGNVDPCPNDADNDKDGDGQCGNVDPCPNDADNDKDGDGACGDVDPFPNDPDDDKDGDGVGADTDPCPNDPDDDKDGDGLCGNVDACPNDADNDKDGDGQCGNVDPCPNDADNDKDGDGLCGNVDPCPNDADNDKDADGDCGDVDACPNDPDNDKDGDGICGDVDNCPNDFGQDACKQIPTVSEWGLIIMTLLLLVAAKSYFGVRRQAA